MFKKKLSFFVQPKKKKIITLTKAPMAHKTFSQEQYVFSYYLISISVKVEFKFLFLINDYIYLFLRNYTLFKFLGTNFFLIKKITTYVSCRDKTFFSIR